MSQLQAGLRGCRATAPRAEMPRPCQARDRKGTAASAGTPDPPGRLAWVPPALTQAVHGLRPARRTRSPRGGTLRPRLLPRPGQAIAQAGPRHRPQRRAMRCPIRPCDPGTMQTEAPFLRTDLEGGPADFEGIDAHGDALDATVVGGIPYGPCDGPKGWRGVAQGRLPDLVNLARQLSGAGERAWGVTQVGAGLVVLEQPNPSPPAQASAALPPTLKASTDSAGIRFHGRMLNRVQASQIDGRGRSLSKSSSLAGRGGSGARFSTTYVSASAERGIELHCLIRSDMAAALRPLAAILGPAAQLPRPARIGKAQLPQSISCRHAFVNCKVQEPCAAGPNQKLPCSAPPLPFPLPRLA